MSPSHAASIAQLVTLRAELQRSDVPAICRITSDSGFFSEAEVAVAEELALDRVENGVSSDYRFVIAEVGQSIVAYASYGPIACTVGSFDLYWIVVDPKHQGHGLGRRLMQECERLIKSEGGRRVYVETSSRAQYAPTRAFYDRSGYQPEATLVDFYAPGDGKVMYVKAL